MDLSQLISTHYDSLHHTMVKRAMVFTHDEEEAEEAVMHCLANVLEKYSAPGRKPWEPTPGKPVVDRLSAFLCRVVDNFCKDELRRKERHNRLNKDIAEDDMDNPTYDQRHDIALMLQYITELPDHKKKVMEIWFQTGSNDETAKKGKWKRWFVESVVREVQALIKIKMGALKLESKIGGLDEDISAAMYAGTLFDNR